MRSAIFACLLLGFAICCEGQTSSARQSADQGYVTTPDGVKLFYQKVGSGQQAVILPGRLFLFRDFQRLANGRSLIFYDMRDRGRSATVADPERITIQNDVDDLETIRKHFGADKPDLIGFSYLGMMVMLYAVQHPDHVRRIVQLGPVPRKFDTKYPPALTAQDVSAVPDPAALKQLEALEASGYIRDHPKEFCEKEWQVTRVQLVGNPDNVEKLGAGLCDLPNEWPAHLYPHFGASIKSIRALDLPAEKIAAISAPVLTIHGTKDRNAPYGSGREWAMTLRDARLVTVSGAAHMSWVDAPDVVFSSIDTFLTGGWPAQAEKVSQLEPAAAK